MTGTLLEFLLTRRGIGVEDLKPHSKAGKESRRYGVRASAEFRRIDALPRRTWTEDPELEELVDLLTQRYKTLNGTQRLWTTQAVAIKEAFEIRGLIGGIRVSGGKTIPSMLIPTVLEAVRPVLFVPAKLREKTEVAYRKLSEHWQLHPGLHIINYEELSDLRWCDWLDRYMPDVIIGDEAHKWRRSTAARTARLERYWEAREDAGDPVTMIMLSGTFVRKKPGDMQRLAEMALREGSPVPRTYKECLDWDNALDPHAKRPIACGALLNWAEPGPAQFSIHAVREGFGRRLTQTPGVIMSTGEGVDCSLSIEAQIQDAHPEAETNFEQLRLHAEAPDGWELVDAPAVWAIAQQLELGFYYVWDPRPPADWRAARKEYAARARQRIKMHGEGIADLDTEAQVAAEFARLGDVEEYNRWVAIRDTFKPNIVPVWFSDRRVNQAADWLHKRGAPGLVWSMHRAFGRRLADLAGVPFYANGAEDQLGNSIVHAKGGPAVVSCFSCNEGLDLQDRWARALYVCPMTPGDQWEQTVARIHRFGQPADEVEIEVWLGCTENYNALYNARSEEFAAAAETLDDKRKLVVADWTFLDPPTRAEREKSWRWYGNLRADNR